MKKELENNMEEITRVEAPDFLLETIISKIETNRMTRKFQEKIILTSVISLLVVNVFLIRSYQVSSNSNSSQTELNPFDYSSITYMDNE